MSQKKNTLLFSILLIFIFLYVGNNSELRGTKRLFISLKIAWFIIFGGLDFANAKDNGIIPGVDGFTSSLSRPAPSNNRLFGSETSSSGDPKKDPYSGSEINPDSKANRPKSTNMEHHFYYQEKKSDDETEDQCPLSEESNRIETGVTKDGTFVDVSASQMRDKSHHMDDFIDPEDIKGKFDIDYVKTLSYKDRLEYVRNKYNLADELVSQMQDEVLKFLTDDETISVPGFLGEYKK
ncbi:MAG: hypothetical protein ACJA2M_002996 [Polaribacter sp.]|jgi:hypothetical protein